MLSRMLTGIVALALAGSMSAHAASIVIDTRVSVGEGLISPLDFETIYSQSIVSVGTTLSELRYSVAHSSSGDVAYDFLIAGARADVGATLGVSPDLTDIRYFAGSQVVSAGTPLTEIVINPNLSTSLGETLFMVFDAFSVVSDPNGQADFAFNVFGDVYAPGEFLYTFKSNISGETALADFNTREWAHQAGRDLGFLALFDDETSPDPDPGPFPDPVPIPAALPLFLSGLGLLGFAGWRRRRVGVA